MSKRKYENVKGEGVGTYFCKNMFKLAMNLTMIRKELALGVKVIILGINITDSGEFLLKFIDPSRVKDLKKIVGQTFLARFYLYFTLFRTVG